MSRPAQPLPPYAGRAAALFDDDIEPQAVGYTLVPGRAPEADDLLRDRTRLGDRVLRTRVVTVTSNGGEDGASWRIGLHTLEELAGSPPPQADFTLDVPATAAGAGVLGAVDSRLVGVTLVAFVRSFASADEREELHFHLAQADDRELRAVRVASLYVGP